MSGFKEGDAFFNANALNLLLLLPYRAIFSRCSVRTIAVTAYLGSITLLFIFFFPHTIDILLLFCNAGLCAKFLAVKTSQQVCDKRVNFNCQVSNFDLLWHVRLIEGKKQGVRRNNLPLFLHRYTVDLDNSLCLKLI